MGKLRRSWNGAFFQDIGAAIAQKKSTTSANGTFADERAQEVVNRKEGFVWFQPMCLSQQEGASALPPVSREPASKMTDSIFVWKRARRSECAQASLRAIAFEHVHLICASKSKLADSHCKSAPSARRARAARARVRVPGSLKP